MKLIHKLYTWLIIMGLILIYLDVFKLTLDRTIYYGCALVLGGLILALRDELKN